MATATLEDAADELLERLSDVGIASDDATVEDVTRKAVPARFVRLGAHLASDVAAVVATGCVGVDDREGVDAAVSAIYRSAANAANNPTAAAARLEQGLRRLAAALDADAAAEDERNSSSSSGVAVAVMSRLVTYVQVGTMLAKKRKRHDFPKDDDVAETDARMDAVTNENENELTNEASLDPAQRARVSERLWRVARALAADDGVAEALVSSRSRSRVSNDGVSAYNPQPPDACRVLDASLAAVRRALRALPDDHLAPAVARDAAARVEADAKKKETLRAVAAALAAEYATRKETVARRCWLTVQAFGASAKLKNRPEVTEDFSRRAGFRTFRDGDGETRSREASVAKNKKTGVEYSDDDDDDLLPLRKEGVALRDVWDARVADLARATQRTNAEASRALDASAKRVRIGAVPDRGGRADAGADADWKKKMPAFAERDADAAKHSAARSEHTKNKNGGRGGGGGRGGVGQKGQKGQRGGRRGGGGRGGRGGR